MSNELDLAYTAGLIDGEGSVSLTQNHRYERRSPNVSLTSTSRELIDFLVETYGGCARVQKVYQDHHRQAWVWSVRQNQALAFLDRVLPYMKEEKKRSRANYIVSGYKAVTPRNGKYTPEMLEAKIAFEDGFFTL